MENNIYIFAQRNTFSCAKEYINAIINVKMRKEEGSIRIHEGKVDSNSRRGRRGIFHDFYRRANFSFFHVYFTGIFFAFFLVIGLYENGKNVKKFAQREEIE